MQALVYDKNPLALRVAKNVNENLEEIGFKNLGIESRKELVVLRRTSMPAVLLEVGFINSKEDNRLFDENFDAIARAIADGVMAALPLRTTHAPTASTEQVPPIPQTTSDASQTTSGKTNQMSADAQHAPVEAASAPVEKARSIAPEASPSDPVADMRRQLADAPCEPLPRMWYYVQVGLFRYPENVVYLMEQLKGQGYSAVWKRIGGLIAIWVGPVDNLDEAVVLQRKLQNDGYETLIVTDDYIGK